MKKNEKKRGKPVRSAISPNELAVLWGMHYRTILEKVESGEIPSFKVGRQIRISMDWVKQQEAVEA